MIDNSKIRAQKLKVILKTKKLWGLGFGIWGFRPKAGFTLVELLLVILTSSIVMGVMANVFAGTWKAQLNQEARTAAQQAARASVETISTVARSAISIEDSLTNNSVIYTTSSTVMILKLASVDTSNNQLTTFDYYIYRPDPNNAANLQQIIVSDPGSARTTRKSPLDLTTELESLNFLYYTGSDSPVQINVGEEDPPVKSVVRVTVKTQKTINNQTVHSSFDDQTHLRNAN